MPKLKAKRKGTLVYLPKYVNAEMLTLEFLRGQTVGITPLGEPARGTDLEGQDYTAVQIHIHVDLLDELVEYINANI